MNKLLLLILFMPLVACGPPDTQTSTADEPDAATVRAEDRLDPHSLSNPGAVMVNHLDLNIAVDFDARNVRGLATLSLQRIRPDADRLILDTQNLTIDGVRTHDGTALTHRLLPHQDHLGSALEIDLPASVDTVVVSYASSPGATGLQWLEPRQTAGGRHPFLFSQSQSIHARSWIPIQDTPLVRFSYTATVRTPPQLRAVMSADNDPAAPLDGEFEFTMPQPIPAYLVALAVGDLTFKAMSDRTGIYAEPELVDAAVREFDDTESMMQTSEVLFGPYRWGRYDLLILPPSFPFGGMENPRLSFITPTVIAGDKSLVALIAHELAHSWSGNLVTNASWDDLWLNESFTVYLESRIMEAVFGQRRRAMEDVLGYQSLIAEMEELPAAEQRLALDLKDRDPDDAFSSVAYEKGRFLLATLESAVGREAFDVFLTGYFDNYAFQSIDTEQFLDYLDRHLVSDHAEHIDMETVRRWVYSEDIPAGAVLPESDAFVLVDGHRQAWLNGERGAGDLPTSEWTVHEWLYFINNLPDGLSSEQMMELDQSFELTGSSNSEIAHSWLLLAIGHRYEPAFERLGEYLTGIGRRKLIQPLYQALVAEDWGKALAREIYQQARPGYHPQVVAEFDQLILEE